MNEVIVNRSSEKIDYSFAEGAAALRRLDCLVVLGHGVTGNKDRPVIADTAAALNQIGFDTLRFSFSGNGDSGGSFGDSTISKEVADLGVVLDAVCTKYDKICYVGHSMGAAVGVVRASLDPRISFMVSLAGMVDAKLFADTEFGDVTPDAGVMWDEESCPLTSLFMNDLCETINSVLPLAEIVSQPWLLLHGTADDVVLINDSDSIKEMKGEAVEYHRIDGADHSFSDDSAKQKMLSIVQKWAQATL